MVPQFHAKYEINLIKLILRKNAAIMDEQINHIILGLFGPFLHKHIRFFSSKKSALPVLSTDALSTWCKISKKLIP